MARSPPGSHFEIWQASSRIHSIKNPVRLKILHLLEERPRRLTELVLFTRKAKSTLSALHLPPLLEGGLVEEVGDRRDARVKIYQLRAHRLGSSAVDVPQLRDAVLAYVQSTGAIPLPSILGILDPEALVREARPAYVDAVAARIGQAVARMMFASEEAPALAELGTLLSAAGLGTTGTDPRGRPRLEPANPRLRDFVERLSEAAMSSRLGRPFTFAPDGTSKRTAKTSPAPNPSVRYS